MDRGADHSTLVDPCSFAVMGYDPYDEALPLLREHIACVQVRGTRRCTAQYAGDGDARWQEILADLKQHDFQGCLTLEPHLGWCVEGPTAGDRKVNFMRALSALRMLLEQD